MTVDVGQCQKYWEGVYGEFENGMKQASKKNNPTSKRHEDMDSGVAKNYE